MNQKMFDEYLKTRYYDQLFYYSNAAKKNQKYYKNFQWTLIIISTITTILAALPQTDNFNMRYVVVLTAAAVTILTAGLKTFQYQELWVSYRRTIEQLKPEIFYYEFKIGDYAQEGIDRETLFVTRVEAILGKEHEAWPMFKQLGNLEDKQRLDNLQKKLDDFAREKFGTQKPAPVPETTEEPAESNETIEGELPEVSGDAEETTSDNMSAETEVVEENADPANLEPRG